MYNNLKSEMTRHGIQLSKIQRLLGIAETTVRHKINGKSDFSVTEAFKVRNAFFPSMTLEYLFAYDEKKED